MHLSYIDRYTCLRVWSSLTDSENGILINYLCRVRTYKVMSENCLGSKLTTDYITPANYKFGPTDFPVNLKTYIKIILSG